MKHLKLTFGDIAQSGILYYDREVEKACKDICETLRIDNMPDYDSKHYYKLEEDEEFVRLPIESKSKLSTEELVFKNSLIEKFRSNNHNVLFVFKGEVLTGIVHLSDYNQTAVLQAIQQDILAFERKLRQYLFLKGLKNEDVIKYFRYRIKNGNSGTKNHFEARIATFEKDRDKHSQLGEFQMFTLKELLEFGNSSQSKEVFPSERVFINNKPQPEGFFINNLRNMAMHGQNPVDQDEESSVYSIDSLNYLFKSLEILKKLTYRIEKLIANHEDYQKSIQMDNRSKLEIIHQHHPKALNFFIGN